MSAAAERAAADYLRTPAAIRARCEALLARAEAGESEHFRIVPARLADVAARVEATTRAAYPDLAVPYHSRWRHFEVGGVDRVARSLAPRLEGQDPQERGRVEVDLAVTSVLLDAGAGSAWRYREAATGQVWGRSEGLALASFDAFLAGRFSSDPARPLRADAAGLRAVRAEDLARAFQAGPDNPLVGLEGRASLLSALGDSIAARAVACGEPPEEARVGHLFDRLLARAAGGQLSGEALLDEVLALTGPIFPGRVTLAGAPLGDVWPHPALPHDGPGSDLVPFHKLSQWLAYSLLEPLEAAGVRVDVAPLTGLPEYRNGGLLVDLGLLEPRHEGVSGAAHPAGAPVIVEWRALTLALLDRVAAAVRERLGRTAEEFPLAKVLQGGTWTAGREVARERRADGSPPIRIESDGTVF